MLSRVGALTAAFTWQPPPIQDRNGEIVAYQLEFNSPEWLTPRELTIADGCNYTITGTFLAQPQFTKLEVDSLLVRSVRIALKHDLVDLPT